MRNAKCLREQLGLRPLARSLCSNQDNIHVYLRCLALGEETRIVTHHHLGFDLPDCIQHHSHYNQERRTTKQLVASYTSELRQNPHNSQDQSPTHPNTITNILPPPPSP